jgi:hypothetical protein
LKIHGYNFFRIDRVGKQGGAVGVYRRDGLSVNTLLHSKPGFDNTPEYIILSINTGSVKILLGVVYARPKCAFPNEFFSNISEFLPLYNEVIITGDFNIDMSKSSYLSELLKSTIDQLNLHLVPSEPTHHSVQLNRFSHTWLDLFIVSNMNSVSSYNKSSAPIIAGHDLI